jgi:acetylornithine deacetylase/succinyl-diaminopimelate desuccinylase-like protein
MNTFDVDAVATHASEHFDRTVERLTEYLRIPAISCEPERHDDVRRLNERVRADLASLGFESRVLELDNALPLVAAERMPHPRGLTVLIYGHLDLQPVRGEDWKSPPHEPERRGDRLYARGAADDMGGWVSHLAAIEAWLAVAGELPVNVRLLLESEEEIGSPNLEAYMNQFPEVFAADVMVLTDCENPSVDLPGLTVSLRGLYETKLSCRALSSDVHSGLWGNMAPDPANALVSLIARLLDADGRLDLTRFEPSERFRADARELPLNREVIHSGAHLLDTVEPLPEHGRPAAEWLWRQPAVTILSTTLPTPGSEKNAIRHSASATLSLRIAPGQTRQDLRAELESRLLRDIPGGIEVELTDLPGGSESWLYEPSGPAFEAADRAYERAWGRPLCQIGIGGSIPFVAMFGRRYGHLPLILNGVMDPETGAHGPNESLHLGVFKKAILANVFLLAEFASLDANAIRPSS